MSDEQKQIDTETMPLADLRALAFAEAEKEAAKAAEDAKAAAVATEPKERTRDAQGRFVKEDGSVDDDQAETAEEKTAREAAEATEAAKKAAELVPEEIVVERTIDVDGEIKVFRGRGKTRSEALEDLTDKLAESNKHASRTIREREAELKKSKQNLEDDDFVIEQRFKEKPAQTVKELVAKGIAEERAATQRSEAAQNEFVETHPDFIADKSTGNGDRIMQWVKSHGYTEFTVDNLDKAYQDLKKSGLLKLKTTDASGTTEVKEETTQRTADASTDTTQSRSQKKSSSISTRGGAPVIKTEPSEDELYSMPMDKLRQLSNDQLAKAGQ